MREIVVMLGRAGAKYGSQVSSRRGCTLTLLCLFKDSNHNLSQHMPPRALSEIMIRLYMFPDEEVRFPHLGFIFLLLSFIFYLSSFFHLSFFFFLPSLQLSPFFVFCIPMLTHVNPYQLISTHINSWQLISTHINSYQLISTHVNSCQLISTHVNSQFRSCEKSMWGATTGG